MASRTLSVASWNVDGLARWLTAGSEGRKRGRATGEHLRLADPHRAFGAPDVLCLQEARVRPTDAAVLESMQGALPGYVCGHALCCDAVNGRFRGGRTYGVVTYVRESLAARGQEAPSWDREGRLHVFELPALNLAIANVYGVNGTDKPYFDHDAGRYAADRYAFKLRFQSLLIEHFAALRARGRRLVLIGDWNVSRSALDVHPRLRSEAPHVAARAMLNERLIPELDVVDAFRELHPRARQYTWWNRVAAKYGRLDAARVDYALISRSLLPGVLEIEAPQDPAARFGSDHAPVYLKLDIGRC